MDCWRKCFLLYMHLCAAKPLLTFSYDHITIFPVCKNRLSAILKASKTVHEVMVFNMQKYLYCKSVFSKLFIEIKQMFKKILSDKINGTKNAVFFLSQAWTRQRFILNLRFLYEQKHKDFPVFASFRFH